MKIDIRRLTLTAVLLSASTALSATVQAQYSDYYGTDGGFADDSDSGVAQTSGTAYIGDNPAPVAGPVSPNDLAPQQWEGPVGHGPAYGPGYGPGPAQMHGGGHGYGYDAGAEYAYQGGQHYGTGNYCDSGCDSGARGSIGRAVAADHPQVWLRMEQLLWFPEARQTPPLGVASAQPGLPTAINNDVIFNDPFGGDLTTGFRGDVGRYFAGGNFGIGGRAWILNDDRDSIGFSGDGTGTSFGIPFFNTDAGVEDAVLVGFDDTNVQVSGNATARSSLDIVAAELYGRALLGQSRNHRLELIGGYSYFNISDDLFLHVSRTQLPAATQESFSDSFRTRNEFHGGQIGNEISLRRGRWFASSLTKVHLGSMSQRVAVNGSSTQGVIGNPANTFEEGLFARGSVQGTRNRQVMSFAPEMNLKLGYRFRDHVTFHAGYSFIFWNNVALAGEQIDRNLFVDPNALGNGGPDRFVDIKHRGYWVQGIDVGTVIEF